MTEQNLVLERLNLQTEINADFDLKLSSEEWQFIQTIRNPEIKKKQIASKTLLRQTLARYLNQSAETIKLAKTAYGKPYLVDYPQINFNLSHTGDVMLVAISAIGAVGVDVEQTKLQRKDFSGLVEKCFAKVEKAHWYSLPVAEQEAEFYRYWTRKEAFVKAIGRGLAIGLEHCVLSSGKSPYFISLPKEYGTVTNWQVVDLDLEANLFGALVIESKSSKN
jgi:4'-phosphopantetheinyl transferase